MFKLTIECTDEAELLRLVQRMQPQQNAHQEANQKALVLPAPATKTAKVLAAVAQNPGSKATVIRDKAGVEDAAPFLAMLVNKGAVRCVGRGGHKSPFRYHPIA